MSRLLVVAACLVALAGAGVFAGEVELSQEKALEHMEWLKATVLKLEADPIIRNDPVQKQEMLTQLAQVVDDFGLQTEVPLNVSSKTGDGDEICFRDLQLKIGQKPTLCINETYPAVDKDGRCYPACRTNFKGFGHICRETCKIGWSYHALTDLCVEIPLVGPNTTGCPWFDSCGHLAAHGCARCPPSHPKEDWLLCECHLNHTQNKYKPASYDRSHGVPAGCQAPRFLHNHLCYFNCTSDYITIGGICYEKCPAHYQEFALICCHTMGVCVDQIKKLATDAIAIIGAIGAIIGDGSISNILDLVKDIIQTVADVLIPDCKGLPPPNSTWTQPPPLPVSLPPLLF